MAHPLPKPGPRRDVCRFVTLMLALLIARRRPGPAKERRCVWGRRGEVGINVDRPLNSLARFDNHLVTWRLPGRIACANHPRGPVAEWRRRGGGPSRILVQVQAGPPTFEIIFEIFDDFGHVRQFWPPVRGEVIMNVRIWKVTRDK